MFGISETWVVTHDGSKFFVYYEDWINERSKEMDVISIEDLISTYTGYRDSHGKAIRIIRSVSGITSIISSSIFIWMLLRSHKGLSTTQHRLLLGLCVFDIIFSLCNSTFNTMVPSDSDYRVWNARGNQATCTAQGFFILFGGGGGLFYNCSLTLYFLAVVKYEKSEEYIRSKIEPFLHGFPIVLTLSFSIALLAKNHYNDDGYGTCIAPSYDPAHCRGYDVGEVRDGFKIPCGRGFQGAQVALILRMVLTSVPVMIMVVSLGMVYGAVRRQEKKLARYGVGSLRVNLRQSVIATRPQQSTSRRSSIWESFRASIPSFSSSAARSNNTRSQSRAVMHKAFAYSFAWLLSYGFYLSAELFRIITGSEEYPVALVYLYFMFIPLQGLFNLLIFMYPKIVAAKKSKRGERVTWCKAFRDAFWSRGSGGERLGPRGYNLRGNRRSMMARKNQSHTNILQVGRNRRQRPLVPAQEEEKTEIQPSADTMTFPISPHSVYAANNEPIHTEESHSNVDKRRSS